MITEVPERAQFASAKVPRRDEWQLRGFKHTWHHEDSRHAAGPERLLPPPSWRSPSFLPYTPLPSLAVEAQSWFVARPSVAVEKAWL